MELKAASSSLKIKFAETLGVEALYRYCGTQTVRAFKLWFKLVTFGVTSDR